MIVRSLFPRDTFSRDLFAEFDRLQRELTGTFDDTPSIRGIGRGGYPALNVGSTPTSVEVYAFAPGIDPARLEVNLDRGVLTIDGERRNGGAAATPETGSAQISPANPASPEAGKTTVHLNERFTGRFRRVVSLPDDVDPNGVTASYRDGVLHVSIQRRAAAQPRRVTIN
jgi:HSP20 family protein